MIVLTPRVSEKAYKQHGEGTYVFNVSVNANKAGVIAAVKEQYGVDAADVRFVVKKGKPVRVNRGKRAYPGNTVRSTTKKPMFVWLAMPSWNYLRKVRRTSNVCDQGKEQPTRPNSLWRMAR